MADNVFPVAIVQPIAKWVLMYAHMPRREKILYVHHVLVVVYVLLYVPEEYLS